MALFPVSTRATMEGGFSMPMVAWEGGREGGRGKGRVEGWEEGRCVNIR
jgi:hypothetical protein